MVTPLPDSTIYVITHEFYPKRGGIATFTEEMARASSKLGFDVEVWAQNAEHIPEKPWPFRLWRLPLKGTHDLSCQIRLALQLIKHRRKLRRATVYLPEPGPMLTLMLLQRFHAFRPKNLLLTFHGSDVLKFHRSRLIRPMAQQLIGFANRISVLSEFTADLLATHFPEAQSKIVRTPGALRSDFESAAPRPAHSPPRNATGKIVILTVGRLHPRKGQLETLRALSSLPAVSRDKIEYWIAGASTNKPQYTDQLKTIADTAGFPVKFLGDVADDELSKIYDQADIFAMTSLDYRKSVEGFGLVYLEASAHGLPVIGHKVGGVPEAVLNGKTGILISPDKSAELTAAFETLITDPNLRQTLGNAGREWAYQNNWRDSAIALFGEAPSPALGEH
ncbi:MAG: glycosyltransferase family 4 protein [Opitutaceae bacterium]|jgi:phosphatidyl-myo-inositol dimannoside synthase|nr:glycosyltransferase family 4 protein [Opitutaceae bacterium]